MKNYMGIDWGSYGIAFPHCLAPWKAVFVQADGFVRPCCIYPPVMGNTNEKKLELIWNDEPYRKLRLAMFGKEPMPDICAGCHDSMRHLDIEWYLEHAIAEKIAHTEDLQSIKELLATMALRGYMILSAIYLLSLIYRKQNDHIRELNCLLGYLEHPQAEHRIRELWHILGENPSRQENRVIIDIVLLSRLQNKLPEVASTLEQMLGYEYSSIDEYIEAVEAVTGKSLPLIPVRLKQLRLDYALYSDMAMLKKTIRRDLLKKHIPWIAKPLSVVEKGIWWARSTKYLLFYRLSKT